MWKKRYESSEASLESELSGNMEEYDIAMLTAQVCWAMCCRRQ